MTIGGKMKDIQKRLIREALTHYDVKNPHIHFIRHNENITCRITEGDNSYALRIHLPVSGFSLALYEGNSPLERLKGEMELLLHLSRTAPFPVQKPVPDNNGEYVTLLSDGTPCEMLQWIEGKPLEKDDTGRYAGDLGILAAQIHEASRGFTGKRLSYSRGLVRKMRAELDNAREQGHLSAELRSVCGDVLSEVERIMTELDEEPEAKSLIHADLSFGNVIQTAQGLAPIDFSLSGFGYRAQECGMLASDYGDKEVQKLIREKYEKESGIAIEKHHMEAFLAFSVLLFITAQHNRYGQEKWFRDSLMFWAKGIFGEVVG